MKRYTEDEETGESWWASITTAERDELMAQCQGIDYRELMAEKDRMIEEIRAEADRG